MRFGVPCPSSSMIKHIVFWTFHEQADGADKAANLTRAKALLLSLIHI